jgi:aspartate kinase
MATLVMKFGGSLMADARRMGQVAQVILAESLAWNRMVVVVSAMAGVTDTLARAVDLAAGRDGRGFRQVIAGIRDEHLTAIRALFEGEASRRPLIEHVDRILYEALATCDRVLAVQKAAPRDYDAVMAAGEKIMVNLMTALVRQEGLRAAAIDAEAVIVTDDAHQGAHPLQEATDRCVEDILRPIMDAGIVPLVAGFIGKTRTGALTTLGRGGSDLTATTLAASLRADEVWIWTYVDGIMSADPSLVPGARVISTLSYDEVGELAYFGARVLHPRAVEVLAPHGIPLRVRNPFNLDHAGTLIQARSNEDLKAVTAVDGVLLSSLGRPVDVAEFLGQVQRSVGPAAARPAIVMQSHLRTLLVLVIPTSVGPNAAASAAQRLSAICPAGRSVR